MGLTMLATASLYGSLVSDAFKDKSTFSLLWHNRPAAELIAPLVVGRAVSAGALLVWALTWVWSWRRAPLSRPAPRGTAPS
jgi:hypothetical protein